MDNSPLGKLPVELRVIIYEFTCPYPTESIRLRDLNDHTALLRTCKEIQREAKPIFDPKYITKVTLPLANTRRASMPAIFRLGCAIQNGKLTGVKIVDCCFPHNVGEHTKNSLCVFIRLRIFNDSFYCGEDLESKGTITRRYEGTMFNAQSS